MSAITSPVKRWPGTVTLTDPLTFPQVLAFEHAVDQAQTVIARDGSQAEYDAALVPGLLACVAEWHLDGLPAPLTAETFPAAPRKASNQLIVWLTRAIGEALKGDEAIPPA